MSKKKSFMVCVQNEEYKASLEVGKIYQRMHAAKGDLPGFVRIVDESGSDYLYPGEYFVPIQVPAAVEEALFPSSQA